MKASERIFVALDTTGVDRAVSLTAELRGFIGGVKLGSEFFVANGPKGVRHVTDSGLPLFLDLKFHDIPSTVAAAVRAVLPLAPFMVNVHGSGGAAMMRAAAAAAAAAGSNRPLVLAVTVLTSLDAEDLDAIGMIGPVRDEVARLAILAKESGLDGAVCSANELVVLRGACGQEFKLIVPGIRPTWAEAYDQKRVITPAEAVALGADYIIIGRPITAAAQPTEAARRIVDEIAQLTNAC